MRHMSARAWAVAAALFILALTVRLLVAAAVPFPTNEVSAWYAGAAERLVAGEWFTSDMVWSYATPPLAVPRPAFELWLPMASIVSAIGMALLGSGYLAAQTAAAVVGAFLAPLTWAVARGAATAAGLDERRSSAISVASGLLAALLGPFILASVVPESTLPFTVLGVAAALLMPSALRAMDGHGTAARLVPALLLGMALGLAYLSRQEAVWLGVAFLVLLWSSGRLLPPGRQARRAVRHLAPVVTGGLLVTGPWLIRNVVAFGSPLPGPTLENAVLTRNLDVFAFLDRPTAAEYLAQGLPTVLGNPVVAAGHQLVQDLVIPAFPVALVGLLGVVALRRAPALRPPTALSALLLSGALTFLASAVLFPVATRWGTFLHASGPLLAGLVVVSLLWADALVARLSAYRGWRPVNVVLGPVALLAIAVPLALLQVTQVARISTDLDSRFGRIADALRREAEVAGEPLPPVVITDHPMWLATVLERPAIALPDEPPASVSQLARTFGAPWLVIIDERGRYPEALAGPEGVACLSGAPVPLEPGQGSAVLLRLPTECAPP
jgi:hypothetical protein